MTNTGNDQPFRPAQFTEQRLITAILDGTYPPGSALPAERRLAEQFGVTRPTIRETLQRLAAEGWISIHHGKSTQVNDFWETGGLSLLGTLARYGDFLPKDLILHLLNFRINLMPPVARDAIGREPDMIRSYLVKRKTLPPRAEAFTAFDWGLQMLLARHSGNPVYPLILNDFEFVFNTLAQFYFSYEEAREASLRYYGELAQAIGKNAAAVEKAVREAMKTSISIWKKINSSTPQ